MGKKSLLEADARSMLAMPSQAGSGSASPFDRAALRTQRKLAVLRAAAAAFNQHGFANTSMEGVAQALQTSKPTLYQYFPSKQAILYECHMHAMNHGEAALSLARKTGKDGLDKFDIFARRYMSGIFGDFGRCSILTDVASLDAEQKRTVVERRTKISHKVAELICEGIKDGSIRLCDPHLAALYALGFINWVPLWYREGGRKTPQEIMDEFMRFFRVGLAAAVAGDATEL